MKIQIKEVKGDVLQITTLDERWYVKMVDGVKTYVPSVTWIAGNYPKGIQFYKWLAEKGWDEAEAIKSAAGDKGSKVHKAIEDILNGKEIKIDDKYYNQSKEEDEELTPQEYECLMSVVSWLNEVKPKILANEYTTFNDEVGYAGTVDLKCEIDGEVWIVDFKTSQNIWTEYELQLSAYKHADKDLPKIAILQVGYTRNKARYKFTELEDKFDLFLAAKQIWQSESGKVSPRQVDYPLTLQWKNDNK